MTLEGLTSHQRDQLVHPSRAAHTLPFRCPEKYSKYRTLKGKKVLFTLEWPGSALIYESWEWNSEEKNETCSHLFLKALLRKKKKKLGLQYNCMKMWSWSCSSSFVTMRWLSEDKRSMLKDVTVERLKKKKKSLMASSSHFPTLEQSISR